MYMGRGVDAFWDTLTDGDPKEPGQEGEADLLICNCVFFFFAFFVSFVRMFVRDVWIYWKKKKKILFLRNTYDGPHFLQGLFNIALPCLIYQIKW